MTDLLKQLEAELSGMQPIPMPENLTEQVARDLAHSGERVSPWGDRLLIGAMGSGVLAACVLIGVLLAGLAGSDSAAAPATAIPLAQTSSGATAPLVFAHGNADWIEIPK